MLANGKLHATLNSNKINNNVNKSDKWWAKRNKTYVINHMFLIHINSVI